jgi:hypothetical protein
VRFSINLQGDAAGNLEDPSKWDPGTSISTRLFPLSFSLTPFPTEIWVFISDRGVVSRVAIP